MRPTTRGDRQHVAHHGVEGECELSQQLQPGEVLENGGQADLQLEQRQRGPADRKYQRETGERGGGGGGEGRRVGRCCAVSRAEFGAPNGSRG